MVPIEYIRQFRLSGYAIFDFVAVFLGFCILAPLLSKLFLKFRLDIPKKNWFFLSLPMSIPIHLLVGQMTPMTRDFLDVKGHYLLKIIILSLLILGLRGIKKVQKMTRAEIAENTEKKHLI